MERLWHARRRSGQAAGPWALAAAALLLALVAAYVMQPGERPSDLPTIRIEYVSDMRAALSRPAVSRDPSAAGGLHVPPPLPPPSPSSSEDPSSLGSSFPTLARVLRASDVEIAELGHPQGDFIYKTGTGWMRYSHDPAHPDRPGTFAPVAWAELPDDLKAKYPQATYPVRGRSAQERSGSGGAAATPSLTGPWDLTKRGRP